jgi:hypothetical protein
MSQDVKRLSHPTKQEYGYSDSPYVIYGDPGFSLYRGGYYPRPAYAYRRWGYRRPPYSYRRPY